MFRVHLVFRGEWLFVNTRHNSVSGMSSVLVLQNEMGVNGSRSNLEQYPDTKADGPTKPKSHLTSPTGLSLHKKML